VLTKLAGSGRPNLPPPPQKKERKKFSGEFHVLKKSRIFFLGGIKTKPFM
jgi:hypothetical protein